MYFALLVFFLSASLLSPFQGMQAPCPNFDGLTFVGLGYGSRTGLTFLGSIRVRNGEPIGAAFNSDRTFVAFFDDPLVCGFNPERTLLRFAARSVGSAGESYVLLFTVDSEGKIRGGLAMFSPPDKDGLTYLVGVVRFDRVWMVSDKRALRERPRPAMSGTNGPAVSGTNCPAVSGTNCPAPP